MMLKKANENFVFNFSSSFFSSFSTLKWTSKKKSANAIFFSKFGLFCVCAFAREINDSKLNADEMNCDVAFEISTEVWVLWFSVSRKSKLISFHLWLRHGPPSNYIRVYLRIFYVLNATNNNEFWFCFSFDHFDIIHILWIMSYYFVSWAALISRRKAIHINISFFGV